MTTEIPKSDRAEYLVYSREHNAWWRPNRCGYTTDEEGAGRYTRVEAIRICDQACVGRTGLAGNASPEFYYMAPEFVREMIDATTPIDGLSDYARGRRDAAIDSLAYRKTLADKEALNNTEQKGSNAH
jgi:hypothetical protein